MNLKTERKVKFWLGAFVKIAFLVLITFKIYDFVTSRKNKDKPVVSTSGLAEKDTLNGVGEIRKEIPSVDTSSFKNNSVSNKQKEELVGTMNPNSISILIYGVNGIDHEITNHLENTLFQKYESSTPPLNILDSKSEVLQGSISGAI